MALSLHTLPIELCYRILDHLNNEQIFFALSGVSARMNDIINSYHPYQVNFGLYLKTYFYYLRNILLLTLYSLHYKEGHIEKESFSVCLSVRLFALGSNYSIHSICLALSLLPIPIGVRAIFVSYALAPRYYIG